MRSILRLAGCAAILALPACSALTDPDDNATRRPGILEFYLEAPVVSLPAEVRAGQRFTVTVTTHSPSSCTDKGDTRRSVSGLTAEVRPFDIHYSGEGISCADMASLLTHEAELVFSLPGTATVRVHGIRVPSEEEVVVIRTVTVLPAS